jgi:undecaprenyl-diphosphatase
MAAALLVSSTVKSRADYAFWISFAAFALFSVVVATRLLHPIDAWILRVAQSRASEGLDVAGVILSLPGTAEYTGAAILVLCAGLFLAGRRYLAGRLLAVFLVTGLVEFAMKTWVPQVPVPDEVARAPDPSPLLEVHYPYPYPSGHMLRAVIVLGAVFLLWPNRLLRTAVMALLLGLAVSRVYLGTHWASDVIGGALLGVTGLAWVFRASQPVSPPPGFARRLVS